MPEQPLQCQRVYAGLQQMRCKAVDADNVFHQRSGNPTRSTAVLKACCTPSE